MRQTAVKLAKSYTPLIKFVGTKHPVLEHSGSVHPHPCTIDGILPGSDSCVSAKDFLSKLKPFEVVPYKTKKPSQKPAGGNVGRAYEFVSRPLHENELASISELPVRFKLRPFEDVEMESINAGGAL
ncbi:LANO_0D00606g1_1 [Lachancea nothofagi CBS 11611]|uniref:LANO_0D00606g1_1 n=1 Tax=Lachancea nothofagi CBS 11611 TaxID=1266666 RepID=A0A1G4JDF3_9SACH|nr:LANO_0D00606g1_1 [Lachancea nothofagi CBS 11611]